MQLTACPGAMAQYGLTPLRLATQNGYVEVVVALLHAPGIDVNAATKVRAGSIS